MPTTISNLLTLSISAICGVLTRVSLNRLFGPQGAAITSQTTPLFFDLPANFLGSFTIGLYTEYNLAFSPPPLLNLAISTGYAGSVTTFASWNFQVVRMFAGGEWLSALFALILGLATASCAYVFGRDMAVLALAILPSRRAVSRPGQEENAIAGCECSTERGSKPCSQSTCRVLILSAIFALLLSGCIVGAAVDVHDAVRRGYWSSAMFAPVGAITRWKLSGLNTRIGNFPIGTFTANTLAVLLDTAIGAALVVHADASDNARVFLDAVITGVGGSLSTVSTWIVEIHSLSVAYRYMYMLSTIVAAQAVGLLVYGTTFWTVG